MTKVNPNDRDETKPEVFQCDIFKSDIVFHWSQNAKIFQWLYNWNLLILLQQWPRINKVKKELNKTGVNLTVSVLIYKVVHHLNEFEFISG